METVAGDAWSGERPCAQSASGKGMEPVLCVGGVSGFCLCGFYDVLTVMDVSFYLPFSCGDMCGSGCLRNSGTVISVIFPMKKNHFIYSAGAESHGFYINLHR